MIRCKEIEDLFRGRRLSAKTQDNQFRRRIEQGANCSPFANRHSLFDLHPRREPVLEASGPPRNKKGPAVGIAPRDGPFGIPGGCRLCGYRSI